MPGPELASSTARRDDDDDEYHRGYTAGDVASRLANHDRHFASIDGSINELAHLVADQGKDLARLITLTEEARNRDEARNRPPLLSPVQRVFAEMAGLAAFAAFAGWILSVLHIFD